MKPHNVFYTSPHLHLRAHVFTVGVVRRIETEGGFFSCDQKHTPNEDDDEVSRHVVTDHQRIDLPRWRPTISTVHRGADTGILIYQSLRGDATGFHADFDSLASAQTFVDKFMSANWEDAVEDRQGAKAYPHAKVLEVWVAVKGEGLKTRQQVMDLKVWGYEW